MAENLLNIVQLAELKLGTHEFRFTLDNTYFQAITPSELLGGEVNVVAKLNLREQDFDLHMCVVGEVSVTCDRCLDPMPITVELDEEMEVEEGIETLDLNWLAYELIIVNLPLVHCHQHGGCNPEMDELLQSHLCTELEEPDMQ